MSAYYNENDPFAAQWLRNLITAGHIAPGDVDDRSIKDVKADDLKGYGQCHFFAGIGVWSHALRLAGVSDDEPVWTGSCPCQPFSAAGKRGGTADDRHLWPVWYDLIRQRRPSIVLANKLRRRTDLGGSILFTLTWKVRVTPLGRPICALRASAHRTSDKDYGSWPTQQTSDVTGGGQAKRLDGRSNLNDAVMTAWATPKASDGSGGRTTTTEGGGNSHLDIQVRAAWPTPCSQDTRSYSDQAAANWVAGTTTNGHGLDLNLATKLVSGLAPSGFAAPTEKRGSLNGAFSRWLMGIPKEWDDCVPTATRSALKSRKHSLK